MTEKASSIFRNSDYRLNCAQVLVFKWCELNQISKLKVSDLYGLGSGRAPGGMCGALYAGIRIFNRDEEIQKAFINKFTAKFGSANCDKIRSDKSIDCKTCIDFIDELIMQLPV